ncbi:cytochrome P450 [Geopyxis carbonaria]|nr:cytochrome P450 [Geopyxis carbonaria]
MGTKLAVLATSAAAAVLLPRSYPQFAPVVTFAAAALTQFVALLVYTVVLYPYYLSPIRHLPGPKCTSWVLGEFPTIFKLPAGEPQRPWSRLPNNGLVRYLGLFNRERIMVTNAKTLQEALHTNASIWVKPQFGGGLNVILGRRGLFFAEGAEHRHLRKQITPAFSHGQVKNLVPVFWEKAVYLGDKVAEEAAEGATEDEKADGKVVDISRWCTLSTLDIIGAAGFGYDFQAMETGGESNELAAAFSTLFKRTPMAIFLGLLGMFVPFWLTYWLPFQRSRDVRHAHRTLQRVCLELVQNKRRALQEGKPEATESRDILSTLLKSGEYDSADGQAVARDQIMTFLAAGHETTSTALSWAVHLLTQYPTIQSALRADVRAAFPAGLPANITFDQLESLKSLRNFCHETLRYIPPVPLTMRVNNAATTLGGEFIPKNTVLVVCPWALHRDPAVWGADADEFRPERWEEGMQGSNYNFQTFLAGPRSCIGKEFSNTEFRALLAVLVGRFEFGRAGGEVEIAGGLTARPKGGLKVRVREVGGWA